MRGRILVVEDDTALSTLYSRVLEAHGFEVCVAATGSAGLACAMKQQFDAVVSDIAMPGMDGMALLERLRELDPVVPVLFSTGQPGLETVQRAIELRAFRYLIKPVNLKALVASVARAASCCRWIRAKHLAALMVRQTLPPELGEHELGAHFSEGLNLLRVYYQPIVEGRGRRLRGFRVLARCLHPLWPTFDDLLRTAARLGRRQELRRKLWSLTMAPLEFLDPSLLLFVWTDIEGLADVANQGAMSKHAHQTVLMVSDREGIAEDVEQRSLLSGLRSQGYRLGVDQLGDGYAGLNSLAWLEPEFVELEPGLVQQVAVAPDQQRLVKALGGLAQELGATLVAEGVTNESDARALAAQGCELFSWDVGTTPDELAPLSSGTLAHLQA